jgi:Putative porin
MFFISLDDPYLLRPIDTVLHNFQFYAPEDKQKDPWRNLGNAGSAVFPLVYQFDTITDFDLGFRQYDINYRTIAAIRHYQTPTPITYLAYNQAPKKDQRFRVVHARNIGKQFQIGVDYNVSGSNGFFARQKTNTDNLNVYTHFTTRNRKYNVFAGYLSNDIDNEQNGGIDTSQTKPEDVFLQSRLDFIPVNLNNTLSDFNQKAVYVQQSYALGGHFNFQVDDSTQKEVFYPVVNFIHQFNFKYFRYNYTDALSNPGFYPEVLLRNDSTVDFTIMNSMENKAGFMISGIKRRTADTVEYTKFRAQAFLSYRNIQINQQGRFFYSNNLSLHALFQNNNVHPGNLRYKVKYSQVFSGYNAGDNLLNIQAGYKTEEWVEFMAFARLRRYEPGFIQNQYLSNHYYWENSWEKQSSMQIGLWYAVPKLRLKLSGEYVMLNKMMYYSTDGLPAQAGQNVNGFVFRFNQRFDWKNWHLDAYAALQFFSGPDILHLPTFVTVNSIYYSKDVFKKALLTHVGFDIRYNTPYQADKFNPVYGQFYLQRDQNLSTYVVIDVFVDLQLKDTRFYFKIENVNSGLLFFDRGYFAAPGYPMPPLSLKFGIDWVFYN